MTPPKDFFEKYASDIISVWAIGSAVFLDDLNVSDLDFIVFTKNTSKLPVHVKYEGKMCDIMVIEIDKYKKAFDKGEKALMNPYARFLYGDKEAFDLRKIDEERYRKKALSVWNDWWPWDKVRTREIRLLLGGLAYLSGEGMTEEIKEAYVNLKNDRIGKKEIILLARLRRKAFEEP